MMIPIPKHIIDEELQQLGIPSPGHASIREIQRLIDRIEKKWPIKFIRMEMGVPGLKPSRLLLEREADAILNQNVCGVYPSIEGVPALKEEIATFAKNFIGIDVSPKNCVPTVGAIHGSFAAALVACRRYSKRDTILFLDPGFPVHKQMVKMMGLKQASLDIGNYRGKKLRPMLEELLSLNKISAILYSNPNNPTWACLNEEELQIIGELANRYDVVAIEDFAYFAMDFRKDYSHPACPPFYPSIAHYSDNYVILLSSSKSFSYPGQRIGLLMISDSLAQKQYPDLLHFFPQTQFSQALIYGAIYASTAGTAHSAQHALAALLHEINSGRYNFLEVARSEYGDKSRIIKNHFLTNGFEIVYAKDSDELIGDGFYFT
ncbi:MAG: pyridoxal phosphate-dependent aminotransferase, partial [Oligoflexia bacterium]|nr:pyridoxal phosphate-dependent aminotransferase [Oligoflexia bacterium]